MIPTFESRARGEPTVRSKLRAFTHRSRQQRADAGMKTSTWETLEALWINTKESKVNRNDECVTITRALAPFLFLIF
ncbi:hypothetical protein KIN20_003436 [Parelaphostrongylus tenuis]|uniref:Uncharacterized protein n=1 Tax=Parelaphostrongylus tenuis TaxID=148309 RepID=A0AAD5M064_PARTN|nr:hypothetical protein KIN20_003436 [Parelaphostrongylus tenuis]